MTATDHLGNTCPGMKAMCEHYGISVSTYDSRIQDGWPLQDVLTRKKITRRETSKMREKRGYDSN